jgi:Spy/CpxP family protein refolding chaperone
MEVSKLIRKFGMILAVAALLMLPFVPRLVRAQMHDEGMKSCGMMGHGMMPIFLRAADLTPAQQAQIKQILQDNRAKMHAQSEQMHAAREAMAAKLLSAGTVTASDLSTEIQQISQAQQQMLQSKLNMALQVRAVLTPAQLQRVAQVHAQFESLHQQMRALMGPPSSDAPPPPDAPPPT